jgi:hypothetical protein
VFRTVDGWVLMSEASHHSSSTCVAFLPLTTFCCHKLLGLIAHAARRCLASLGKGLNDPVPVMNDEHDKLFYYTVVLGCETFGLHVSDRDLYTRTKTSKASSLLKKNPPRFL